MGRRAVVGSMLVSAIAACGIDAVGLYESGPSSSSSSSSSGSGSGSSSGSVGPSGLDGGANEDASVDAAIDGPSIPTVPPLPLEAKAACGRPSVYVDDFADGVPSTFFNDTASGGSITEQNGNLVLSYAAGANASHAAKAMVNLQDDRLRVAVPIAPPATARVFIGLRLDDTRLLAFVIENGTLYARQVDGGPASNVTASFDPVAHRWLQISESGGTTKWETSPDGLTWSTLVSRTTPSWATTVRPVLSAGDPTGAGPAGQVYLTRLNAGRPVADWCKMQTFSDEFGDGQISRFWDDGSNGACTGGESSGELRFGIGAAVAQCGWRSTVAYDLMTSAAYLEVPAITNYHPQLRYTLRVVDIASSSVAEIGFIGSNNLVENASGLAGMTTPYNTTNDRWWRIRESAGMIYWESSSNGSSWAEKRKAAVGFPVTSVKVGILGEATAQMPGSISIGVPRFNAGP